MADLIPELLDALPRRRVIHADGTDKFGRFFLNIERVVDYPRITRHVKQWQRRGKAVEITWSLDGGPEGTAEAVIEALAKASLPETTPVERAALLTVVNDDWTEQQGDMPIRLQGLSAKALIEWRDDPGTKNHCRRTDLGRAVLAHHLRTEDV